VSVRLHQSAYEHAQKMIRNGQCILDRRGDWTDHKPARTAENRFIAEHGRAAFGKSHLGEDDEEKQKTASAATNSHTATSRMFITVQCCPRNHAPASTSTPISSLRLRNWVGCWMH
jgi:hypothetical protein